MSRTKFRTIKNRVFSINNEYVDCYKVSSDNKGKLWIEVFFTGIGSESYPLKDDNIENLSITKEHMYMTKDHQRIYIDDKDIKVIEQDEDGKIVVIELKNNQKFLL